MRQNSYNNPCERLNVNKGKLKIDCQLLVDITHRGTHQSRHLDVDYAKQSFVNTDS